MLYNLGTQIIPIVRAQIGAVILCTQSQDAVYPRYTNYTYFQSHKLQSVCVFGVRMLCTLGTQIIPTFRAIIAAVCVYTLSQDMYTLGTQIIPIVRAQIGAVILCTQSQDAVYPRYTNYTYFQSHKLQSVCVFGVRMLCTLGTQIIPTFRAIIAAVCEPGYVYPGYTNYTYCQSLNSCRRFVYSGSGCCIP